MKVQSNNPTIVPRVHLYFNDITRVQRVQPPAATPSPQQTLRLSKQIPNLSKPIVYHNANVTVHLSALEEQFISDMMNIKAVPDPTTGDLLEIPEAILWRDGVFNKLSRLTQGRKKRTIKGKKHNSFNFTKSKTYKQKTTYAQIFVSYRPQKQYPYRLHRIVE